MNNALIELCGIQSARPSLKLMQSPGMKALALLEHFQGHLVRIRDRIFHIPVIHLQGNRKQGPCKMVENCDGILSFHRASLPTLPSQANGRNLTKSYYF